MPSPHVTHVLVGYSALVMNELDRFLPEASVLILEEPHVIAARDVHTAAARHTCVAEVRPAATQDETNAGKLAAAVGRPPAVRAVL
ncbi:ATP-grasp domain-containing protein, partial [Streptomyces sp. NPDC002690]